MGRVLKFVCFVPKLPTLNEFHFKIRLKCKETQQSTFPRNRDAHFRENELNMNVIFAPNLRSSRIGLGNDSQSVRADHVTCNNRTIRQHIVRYQQWRPPRRKVKSGRNEE